MRTLRITTLAAATLGLLALSACGTQGGGTASPSDSPDDTGSQDPGASATSEPSETDTSGTDAPSMESLAGKWVTGQPGDAFLELHPDGRINGTDGCNGIGTTYTLDGTTISIEPWVTTARGCPDIDTWLSGARGAEVRGDDELLVKNQAGEEIGTLTREG